MLCRTVAASVVALSYSLVGFEVEAQAIVATQVLELGPDRGGPERTFAALAVSATGQVAYTFGYDQGDALVTLRDRSGRLIRRAGRSGSGPGEFSSVLALFFRGEQLLAFGPGQISAFTLSGRHEWSRALDPFQFAVAVNGDSVDLMDARFFADGRGLGSVHRRSLERGGGQRLLLDGTSVALKSFARAADDSLRFIRVGFASTARAVAIGNPQSGAVVALRSPTATGETLRAAGPIRRRTNAELNAELERLRAQSAAPFKMPDGSLRRLPFNEGAARSRLAAPVQYFNARSGGMQIDQASGDVIIVSADGERASVTRISRSGRREGSIPCDLRDGAVAVAWPYLAATCEKLEDGERVPVLRLYQLR